MKLKYLFTTLLAGAMFMSGCTEVSLENPLEEVQLSSSYVYIPVEGGEAIISLTATTDWSFNEELIPEWLDVTPTNGSAGTEEVKFSAEEAESDRSANLEILANGKTQYIIFKQAAINPEIKYSSCKQVNDAANGANATYYVQGVVTMIENTEYGNMFINDGTGTLYIYGTLDADGKEKNFLSLGIGVGDKISIKGPRSVYNDVPQLSNITVIDIQKSAIRSEVEEYVIEKDASDKIEIELIGTGFDSYFFGQYADKEEDRVEAGWVKFLGMTMSDDKCKVKLHVDANDVEGFRSTSLRFTAGESIAEITLTQKGIIPEAVTTTEELVADDYVKISGTVYAVSAKGILVKDNTGYVLCTDENYDAGAGLGEIVEVVGKVGSEDNCTVIVADQIERKEVDKNYKAETAIALTAETAADYFTADAVADFKYFTLTGAVKEGEMTLGEYTIAAYEPAEDLDPSDLDDGANATLTGYVVSIDKEKKILGLLLTSLEEQKEDTAE